MGEQEPTTLAHSTPGAGNPGQKGRGPLWSTSGSAATADTRAMVPLKAATEEAGGQKGEARPSEGHGKVAPLLLPSAKTKTQLRRP